MAGFFEIVLLSLKKNGSIYLIPQASLHSDPPPPPPPRFHAIYKKIHLNHKLPVKLKII